MRKELLKGLTEEQIAKVEKCKSPEEILALAKEEGVELTEDQMEAVNGGFCGGIGEIKCPECKSMNIHNYRVSYNWICDDCGCNFEAGVK